MLDLLAEPFMQYALASAVLVGALCAFLGTFLVLRRMVFLAVALSELAACGVALGLWLHVVPMITAYAACLLGIGLLMMLPAHPISREAAIGALYAAGAAAAMFLLAINPMAHAHGIDLLAGDILYASPAHVAVLAALVAAVAALSPWRLHQVLLVAFDRDCAQALHLPAARIEGIFMLLTAFVVAFSLRVAGAVYVCGALILPPVFGLLAARRVGAVLALAIGAAVCAATGGLLLSARHDMLPAGPAAVCLLGLLVLVAAACHTLRAGLRRARRDMPSASPGRGPAAT